MKFLTWLARCAYVTLLELIAHTASGVLSATADHAESLRSRWL